MIFKITWKKIESQFLNYSVYFISMIFAVMIYYCFSVIAYNQSLIKSAGKNIPIQGLMFSGNFLVVLMVLVFMLAANHFFLLKRNQEIKVYRLIGMRKSHIFFIFFKEILFLGITALGVGLFLGIIFSKLFLMMLVKAMFLNVNSLFYVSIPAMIQTSIIFIFLLIIILVRSMWVIYHYNLNKHVYHNEYLNNHKFKKVQFVFGVLGIFFILLNYGLIYDMKTYIAKFSLNIVELSILFLYIIGTYLFLRYSILLIVHLFSKIKRNYYQGLQMVVYSNIQLHLKRGKNLLSMATIFIALSLTMISGVTFVYGITMHDIKIQEPIDFIADEAELPRLKQIINQFPNTKIKKEVTLHYKVTGGIYSFKSKQKLKNTIITPMNILSFYDYNKYQKINPNLKRIWLQDEKSVAILNNQSLSLFKQDIQYHSCLQLKDGHQLSIHQVGEFNDNWMSYNFPIIVVSDKSYATIKSEYTYKTTALVVHTNNKEELSKQVTKNIQEKWRNPIYYALINENGKVKGDISKNKGKDVHETDINRLNYTDNFVHLQLFKNSLGILIYVALFLGVLAFFITGNILMLHQLGIAEQEKEQYHLLKHLGVTDKEIAKLVYRQNSLIFFPPMILGLSYAFFVIQLLVKSSYWLTYFSCGILIFIYFVFYLITSAIYLQTIQHKST